MPRSFFDQVLVSTPRRRSRPIVTAGSVLLHTLALGLLFVLPLTAAFELPAVRGLLPPVMLATTAELPPEPVITPAATTPQLNQNAAPIKAPDYLGPEAPRPSASSAPPIPGGLPGTSPSPTDFVGLPGTGRAGPLAPPPPPAVQAPIPVGGDVDAPTRIVYKAPVYPQVAIAARLEGTVILETIIDAQGVVENVTVLRSMPMLDRAAIEAVRQWRYTPTRLNGQAVPVIMTVTVTFTLR